MFNYFGYGSNMNPVSLRHKGVVPERSVRGTLQGWRLTFNVHHWFRHEGGVGNIVPALPDDRVEGIVHRIDEEQLARLDAVESYGVGYDRITVTLDTPDGPVDALTYVGIESYLDDGCLPSPRYRNIVVAGAEASGLPEPYVAWLRAHPVYEHPPVGPYRPPPGDWPTYDADTLPRHHTALAGHVFDMEGCRWQHECLLDLLGGKDMTLFHLRRLDTSDGSETLGDLAAERYRDDQRVYLDAYLSEYDREYRYAGRFRYPPEEDA